MINGLLVLLFYDVQQQSKYSVFGHNLSSFKLSGVESKYLQLGPALF